MKRYLSILFAGASALAVGSAAQAQTASTSGSQLDEIVVTARKQVESILETPVSVTALSAQAISAKGIANYTDIARYAPGLNFQNQSVNRNDRSFNTIQTRGVANGTTIFIDGVAVSGATTGGGGTTGGVNDIAQIEIVNGPQSATFGRSSFAGAINFITARPKYEFGANLDVSAAQDETYELKASVEGPLIGTILAGKLSFLSTDRGEQFDNFTQTGGLGQQSTRSIAGSLLFEPNDKLTVYYRGSKWVDDDGPPAQGVLGPSYYNCATPTAVGGQRNYVCGAVSSVPAERMIQQVDVPRRVIDYVTGQVPGVGYWLVGPDFIDHFGTHREAQHHAVTWDYELPFWSLTLGGNLGYATDDRAFITDVGFQNGQLRPTPGTGAIFQLNPSYRNPAFATRVGFADLLPYFSSTAAGSQITDTNSAEIRLASDTEGRLTWMVGYNYLTTQLQTLTNGFSNVGFANSGLNTVTDTKTNSVFGLASFAVGYGIKLIAEGRIQNDEIEQRVLAPGGLNASGTFKSKTPRVIVQYEPRPNLNFYASYSEGVRPGTFNGSLFSRDPRILDYIQRVAAPGISLLVPEERLKMTEIGFKGRLLDNRLSIMAAAYRADYVGRQLGQNVTYPGTPPGDPNPIPITGFIVTSSSGVAELYGFEVQGAFQATDALRLEATYAYAETLNKLQNCTNCLALLGNANPIDTRFGLYPAVTGSFSVSYERPAFADYTGFARLDYSYRGRIYADSSELVWTAPSHNVNGRIGIRNERYGLELFGRNIFDNKVPSSLGRATDTYTPANNTVSISPPDPQTFGVRATVKY